jgi:dihydrofolate synthase/folylpolyglutamate synthase
VVHQSSRIETYDEAVRFLEEAINYEKIATWSYNSRTLNLSRTRCLLASLGNPQDRYGIVHVAGTKGKGSTSGAVARILTCNGYRTGLLTSPHLVTHRERICVDDEMISEDQVAAGVRAMQAYVQQKRWEEPLSVRAPTYFEMLTALGLRHFAEVHAAWAVIEVALGGRWDSTNVVTPKCCIVTSIGFEHTDKLGNTAEEIAREKAGIFKPQVPVVLGRQSYPAALSTLREVADQTGCPRWEVGRDVEVVDARPLSAPPTDPEAPVGWQFSLQTPVRNYPDLTTPLLGRHQLDNLAAAVAAVLICESRGAVRLQPGAVAEAIAGFTVPGRLEVLQRDPLVILDVAHTVESVAALLDSLRQHFPERALRIVFGCSVDKNVRGILGLLRGRCVTLTATQADMPRAIPAADIEAVAREVHLKPPDGTNVIPDAWSAAQDALSRAKPGEAVCIVGSFYTAGEIRKQWFEGREALPN